MLLYIQLHPSSVRLNCWMDKQKHYTRLHYVTMAEMEMPTGAFTVLLPFC